MVDEVWESTFARSQLMWGRAPTASALVARDDFARHGVKRVLIPGVGYGRNAKPFLDAGISVTGIEISETAIKLARSELGLEIMIHHGSVLDMPFDEDEYDAVFGYGLLYLLDAEGRQKLLRDCWNQLAPGGRMIFTVIAKTAPQYGKGTKLAEDWYENPQGIRIFFYDEASARRELADVGFVACTPIDEPMHGKAIPFLNLVCAKP